MSRKLTYFVAGTIIVGCLTVAVVLVAGRPEPARQSVPSRVPFAATAPVVAGAGSIPVFGAGTVRPRAEVDVTAEVAGKVVWVAPTFQSGGRVHPGQLLFQIHDAEYRNRVDQARASVAHKKVELQRVTAEALVARDHFEELERSRGGDAPIGEPSPLALWEPQLDAAKADLASAQAALASAELALSRTEVHAPFAGVVLDESVDVGQFVALGRSVGRLYASDAVEVAVPLSDAGTALIPGLWKLEAGNDERRVSARVVAKYGDGRYAWEGYVDRAEVALDERTRTTKVIVRVPNPFAGGLSTIAGMDGRAMEHDSPPLLVGKFVEVEISGLIPDEYFRVRRPALRPGNEVWVVRNDTVRIVPVHVLQRTDDEVFVTGALDASQVVIIGGVQVAIDGMPVRTDAGDGS